MVEDARDGQLSRSSSVGGPKAWVSRPRASSHSSTRFTVSPLPTPSAPARSTMTGTPAFRSFGTSASDSSLPTLRPSSAVSNTPAF